MKRMKHFALLILVVGLLCGCTEGSDVLETSSTVPSHIQMDQLAAKKLEIEDAWLAANGTNLGAWYTEEGGTAVDGVRYYGSFDDLDILFEATQLPVVTTLQIGGETFTHSSSFRLLVHQDGAFFDLKDAYEDGLLSDESLDLIAALHLQYQQRLYPLFTQPPMDGDILQQMKLAFLEQYVKEGDWSEKDLTVIYYGEYDGAHVGFINGIFHYTQAFTSEKVGKITFQYATGQKLLVYHDGTLMGLSEAYEQGILSDEAVVKLYQAYAKVPDGEKE